MTKHPTLKTATPAQPKKPGRPRRKTATSRPRTNIDRMDVTTERTPQRVADIMTMARARGFLTILEFQFVLGVGRHAYDTMRERGEAPKITYLSRKNPIILMSDYDAFFGMSSAADKAA